jgi:hypothetical protein
MRNVYADSIEEIFSRISVAMVTKIGALDIDVQRF